MHMEKLISKRNYEIAVVQETHIFGQRTTKMVP
jgi:hypothetical protein